MTRPGTVADPAHTASSLATGLVIRQPLVERLRRAARVVALVAPPGSGKTYLLHSWIHATDMSGCAAWVSVQDEERDSQRFWISVLDALRGTAAGSPLVRGLTAAPDLDGGVIVERLLKDLASLEDRVWLVIDDLHELRSRDALLQLELLVMRAPQELRFVLSSRHDLRLGLHRLRLQDELTEIRAADLRFSVDEARALFDAAGVVLSEPALALLVDRTEGWAAGLRLAALSLAGQPNAERLAAEFSGSERTVGEYLLAEVLDRQPEQVRRLLLRTSVLERVSGPLADLLTDGSGGERILQELEEANAFVVSVDARRTWFRYHRLFAGLLQLQLRRTAPDEITALHSTAAEWYADHGSPVEAIRHAQAAQNWILAARLLCDHWFGLYLDAQAATAHDLLTGFPAEAVAADAELTALMAADNLNRGTFPEAERYLTLAAKERGSVPADRRRRLQVVLAVLRLQLARQRNDLPTVAEEAARLLTAADSAETAQLEISQDLRAFALINLGIAELWTFRLDDAARHLDQGTALAHRIDRPYLELTGLAHGTLLAIHHSYALTAQRSTQATVLAERHGWGEDPIVGIAYTMRGGSLTAQGRLEEAGQWLDRAERALRFEVEPAATVTLQHFRGCLELGRGRYREALEAFRTAERLAGVLVTPFPNVLRAELGCTLAKMGELEGAEQALAEIDDRNRKGVDIGPVCIALAVLRLAQDDPQAATVELARAFDRWPSVGQRSADRYRFHMTEAFLLEAIARDALSSSTAAARALEHALDLAEPEAILLPFLLHPVPGLLERHRWQGTAHTALVSEILDLLTESETSPRSTQKRPHEPLTDSEIRILRYLPTNLSQQEIACELSLSVNTVNTHIRHLYTKLDAHRRGKAVERARYLGLLAPTSRRHGASSLRRGLQQGTADK